MPRPVTLFTGQWADLPLTELAAKAAAWGFDGLELACWGDHFEVDRALAEDGYVAAQRQILEECPTFADESQQFPVEILCHIVLYILWVLNYPVTKS